MTEERKTYTAKCERDPESDYWLVEILDLEGVFTQGKNLRECAVAARDVIALWLEVHAESFDLVIVPYQDGEPVAEVVYAVAAKADRERAAAAWEAASAAAVHELEAMGATQRDIAEVLGVSHQRVGQIGKTADSFEKVGGVSGLYLVDRNVVALEGSSVDAGPVRIVAEAGIVVTPEIRIFRAKGEPASSVHSREAKARRAARVHAKGGKAAEVVKHKGRRNAAKG